MAALSIETIALRPVGLIADLSGKNLVSREERCNNFLSQVKYYFLFFETPPFQRRRGPGRFSDLCGRIVRGSMGAAGIESL
jgi:hypothetical protein